jgi:hypothetical protein
VVADIAINWATISTPSINDLLQTSNESMCVFWGDIMNKPIGVSIENRILEVVSKPQIRFPA